MVVRTLRVARDRSDRSDRRRPESGDSGKSVPHAVSEGGTASDLILVYCKGGGRRRGSRSKPPSTICMMTEWSQAR